MSRLLHRRTEGASVHDKGSSGSTSISLRALTKKFGDTQVIEGLDIDIKAGELLVLLGPSGSGKTTTLNLICGLEEADSGAIYFAEREVTSIPPEDRDIAVVFQNYSLYPHMNVRQNITFPLRMRRVPDAVIRERLTEVTEMLGIDQLLKRRINELSGGQRQRVAIAKALTKRPEAFLLDEPFSALDAVVRRQLRSELVQLHRELRTTMIFVTHDQDEAMTIADRIAVMREGRVVQIAAPLAIYRDPVDLWVAEFIGGHPINVLRVSVSDGRARLFDATGDPLDVPAAIASELIRVGGSSGEIVLGVRPELVQVCPADGQTAGTGKILTRQLHGTEILYEVELEKGVLRAVVPSLPGTEVFAQGDAVSFDFLWAGVFAFAADSGARLRAEFAPIGLTKPSP